MVLRLRQPHFVEGIDTNDERRDAPAGTREVLDTEPPAGGAEQADRVLVAVRCECGSPGCRESVSLTPAAREAFRRTSRPVLAPGHRPGRMSEARRSAAASVEDARALRAQSGHQLRRARRSMPGRVLVVDDSEAVLNTVAPLVSAARELRLAGTATSGEEAIRLLPRLKPDLVLLDVHMPGLNGVETARVIRRRSPQTVVVLFSAEPAGLAGVAQSAGAVALLGKADLRSGTLDELWLKHLPRE